MRVILLKGRESTSARESTSPSWRERPPWSCAGGSPTWKSRLITISRLNKPVIAQVQGTAAANGAGLVARLRSGHRVRKGPHRFDRHQRGLNCVGPVIPVSKCVGRKVALEMLLFGELLKAEDALAKGLFNKVVPHEELDEAARQWAATLAQKSPIAVQIAKSGFYTAADMEYHQAFEYMNEVFARLCTTEDAKEGVTASGKNVNPCGRNAERPWNGNGCSKAG